LKKKVGKEGLSLKILGGEKILGGVFIFGVRGKAGGLSKRGKIKGYKGTEPGGGVTRPLIRKSVQGPTGGEGEIGEKRSINSQVNRGARRSSGGGGS